MPEACALPLLYRAVKHNGGLAKGFPYVNRLALTYAPGVHVPLSQHLKCATGCARLQPRMFSGLHISY